MNKDGYIIFNEIYFKGNIQDLINRADLNNVRQTLNEAVDLAKTKAKESPNTKYVITKVSFEEEARVCAVITPEITYTKPSA